MKTITLKAFKKLNPCWLDNDEKSAKLEEIGLRKDRWSAVDILRLSNDEVSAEDRLWSARWLIDDKIMHEFACRCAEEALKLVESPDPRSVAAIAAKRAWLRGEINDEQLDAAGMLRGLLRAKKLITVWLALTIMLFSSISIYADQNVQGDFFFRDVVVNGEQLVNYNLQYPVITYNNTTYLPLSEDIGRILGFVPSVDWESRTLKLVKAQPTQKNLSNNTYKGAPSHIAVQVLDNFQVLAVEESTNQATEEGTENTESQQETIIEELALTDSAPLLAKGKYVYVPVRVFAESEIFQWDLHYDSFFGLCISSLPGVPAKNAWSEKETLYNRGLYAYIKEYNWNIPAATAQRYVFLFKRAGDVYSIDEKLLMAVAHKESTFNAGAVSRFGALGMMQIMPATGARYGLSNQQLLDPKVSISVGAMILSERIAAYGGDVVKGLSAYNQGSVTVSRGTYSTSYASRVLSAHAGVNNFLATNGFVAR